MENMVDPTIDSMVDDVVEVKEMGDSIRQVQRKEWNQAVTRGQKHDPRLDRASLHY